MKFPVRNLNRRKNWFMKVRFLSASCIFFLICIRVVAQDQVTLEQAVALALEKNYDVRLAENVSESATTDKSYAWGALTPQVTATGSLIWNQNNQELKFEDASRNNSGKAKSKNTTASVQLNWILFDGTKMFATLDRVNTIAAQGELIVKDQMVNSIASIITGYYGIVRQKQQLKAIEEQMGVSEERVKLAERKLQVGTGSKPELLQARVDYNAQRTQVILQEALILQLKEQLNALTGSQLPSTYEVADSIVIDLDLRMDELSSVENSNYTLKATRLNLDIARISVHERKAEMSPVLSFNGAYNYAKTDNITLINPFAALYNQTKGINYGFTVTLPILTGFNTRREIQQASINYNRQQLLYDQQKLTIDVQVKTAFVNYDNAKKILLIEEENILLAKENVFIALEGFKRGVITSIELRTAQQSLADAYNRLINARYIAKAAETELLRLSGQLLK
jgi:outer membrane protein